MEKKPEKKLDLQNIKKQPEAIAGEDIDLTPDQIISLHSYKGNPTTLALMKKPQAFAPDDAVEADQALRPAERPLALEDACAHHSPPAPPPVNDVKASPIERAPAALTMERDGPSARTRPLWSTIT